MSRKFSGGWIIFNILGAAALFIVLIVGANMLLKVITKHNQEIRVPDLTAYRKKISLRLIDTKPKGYCQCCHAIFNHKALVAVVSIAQPIGDNRFQCV